jgi:hypothetical protein
MGYQQSSRILSKTRAALTDVDDDRGIILATGSDGVVDIATPKVLTSALASFLIAGVETGDFLKIGSNYWTITGVTATTLTVSANMPADTLISFDVVQEIDCLDMTNSTKALFIAKFNGGATSITFVVEAEFLPTSGYRARIGTATTLTGNASQGAAVVVEHGGALIRTRVTAITPNTDLALGDSDGVVDVASDTVLTDAGSDFLGGGVIPGDVIGIGASNYVITVVGVTTLTTATSMPVNPATTYVITRLGSVDLISKASKTRI